VDAARKAIDIHSKCQQRKDSDRLGRKTAKAVHTESSTAKESEEATARWQTCGQKTTGTFTTV